MMHYLLRPHYGARVERFEADQELAFARRWDEVYNNMDAGSWMILDDRAELGTHTFGEGRWQRPGFFVNWCVRCNHEFWSRRSGDSICFACLICERPATPHRPLRDEWRCDGVGEMDEHRKNERGICQTCRRPWPEVEWIVGRRKRQSEGHEDKGSPGDARPPAGDKPPVPEL